MNGAPYDTVRADCERTRVLHRHRHRHFERFTPPGPVSDVQQKPASDQASRPGHNSRALAACGAAQVVKVDLPAGTGRQGADFRQPQAAHPVNAAACVHKPLHGI